MNEQEILKKAVETYGEESQIDMAIEECSELIQALCKYKRAKHGASLIKSLENVAEEMADVEIMMAQLKLIFKNNLVVEAVKAEKLKRLENNLNN